MPTESDRGQSDNDGLEGHVDLHSWMIALQTTMAKLFAFITHHSSDANNEQTALWSRLSEEYAAKSRLLLSRLDDLHWNETESLYCDYAYRDGERFHICHRGYVAFFPLMFGLIPPDSPKLPLILHELHHGSVWTAGGVRSLASTDRYFGKMDDYWSGHIWINLNYLIVQALAYYSATLSSPASHQQQSTDYTAFRHILSHMSPIVDTTNTIPLQPSSSSSSLAALVRSMYEDLRHNLMVNMHSQYSTRGYIFEQYDSLTLAGRKSHPFTGWSALIVNIMAQQY